MLPDRDEHVLERRPARVVRVDVAGDDRLHAERARRGRAGARSGRVAALERPLQLDEEAVGAERPRQPDGGVRVADAEPVAGAAGEADEPLGELGEQRRVERGRQRLGSFLRARVRVRGREEAAEVRVAAGRLDEQRHVRPTGEGHLGAGDRADADELRRVRELERAVDALVVGERERLVAELGRAQRELLGVRGAVEEGVG